MTIMVENLDGVEGWTPPEGAGPIPLGDHPAKIAAVEEGKSSKGSPQLIISWEVISGPYVGTTSREWLVVLPQTYGKVKAFLEAIQFPIAPGQFAMPTTELVGKSCVIVVREDTYGGGSRPKVMGHLPLGDVPIDYPAGEQQQKPKDDGEPLPF